jgi:two-component system, OmpR family, sensor kinase
VAYVLLLAIVALGVPLALSLRDRVDAEVRGQARSQADVVAASAAELLNPRSRKTLEHLTAISARTVRGRVAVIAKSGRVLADSAGSSTLGTNYGSRPEVASALGGQSFQDTRNSQTLGTDLLATAAPIVHNGRPIGAVRITQSVDAVNSAVRRAVLGLALLSVIVLGLGLTVGALIAQQIARPIRRLGMTAREVAAGDLEATAPIEGSTEQRSLARSFNDMTERVSRLLRSQRDFVADASHQLRTPLTGLRLQLEELREATPAKDPRAIRMTAGLAEVDRLSRMVDELLILSRVGEHEHPGTEVDLAQAADRARERWDASAREAGLSVTHDEIGNAGVLCTVADLDRALDALIENAIRYSPPGSEVTIATSPGRIEIIDEGPGLEPGEEDEVFERFHRGRAGRMGPSGTGLGLAIARELVEQWGATVTLANADERGTRAVIEWARHKALAGDGDWR